MGVVYCIKKEMVDSNGKRIHILLTNGLAEVLEFKSIEEANKIVEVMNANTDSGWNYSVIPTGKV